MDDEIEYLYSTGMGVEEIAEQLGIPVAYVEDVLELR